MTRLLGRVPAPLAALAVLFAVSLVVLVARLAVSPAPEEPIADDAVVSATPSPDEQEPAEEPAQGPAQGAGVLPGEVEAPAQEEVSAAPSTAPLAEPVRVAISAIGLDEGLIDLGIADDGTMQVPADPDRVGWFAGGARPGGPGPVVVAAHVDSLDGPAVFHRLSDLTPGDEVAVTTTDGTVARYEVSRVRAVPRDDFPTAQVFGSTAGDVVRLITCHGPYDRGGIGYTENLVVTAQRVG